MYEKFTKNMKRLAHDCFRIKIDDKVIYTDPFKLPFKSTDAPHDADLILISHDHFDHCSPEDIAKIQKSTTRIVANISCKGKIKGSVIFVSPNETETIDGIQIKSVPAYNTKKERQGFHPKRNNNCGYVFGNNDIKIYFAGDTDAIPEMKDIKCNIALLPVSGTYVMDFTEALLAAEYINPDVVIPMHYGAIVGSDEDAYNFMRKWKGKTIIL